MKNKGLRVRRQILDSADRLFYHRGYADTAFAQLAEQARIPKGNFYYYYKTKDKLLKDVLEQRLAGIRNQLKGWEAVTGDPAERLHLFVKMVRDNADTLSRYGCPIGTINSELGKARQDLQDNARALISAYRDWLADQLACRFSREQSLAHANHLMAAAEGAALMGHIYQDAALIREQAERMDRWIGELLGTRDL